jgi:dolichol kinase
MTVYYPSLSFGKALILALAAAVPGAVAELLSRRVDDNFTIPLAVGAGVSLTWMLLM